MLDKFITVKKQDDSWVSGKCIDKANDSVTMIVKDSGRKLYIPMHNIKEIIIGEDEWK
jgi:hypothetical protein